MSESLFFRLLKDEEKDGRLRDAIQSLRASPPKAAVHTVAQATFGMIPGAPFAYWVSDDMRARFKTLPLLQSSGRVACSGGNPNRNFRFVRLWAEVPLSARGRWVDFAKGGEFAPYYADVHLVLDWESNGAGIKAFLAALRDSKGWGAHWAAELHNSSRYFMPGLTWSARTQGGLSLRVMPAGCVFGHKGPAVFAESVDELGFLLALLNSLPGRGFVDLQMAFGSYEVGVIQRVPIPAFQTEAKALAARLARSIHNTKRVLDSATENSHAFVLPAVLRSSGPALGARLEEWNRGIANAGRQIMKEQREIDEICHRLYEIGAEDRATIEAELGTDIRGLPEPLTGTQAAADLVSWIVGVVLGRFDVRLAAGGRAVPDPPEPFERLPAYTPGMLPEGRVPAGYPIAVDEDGILVDDEGQSDDVVARVRDVLHLLWKDQADAIEKETCGLLGVKFLRDYFGRMGKGGFWDDHFRRYTKSRRRAPIVWPLQSPRGLARVWLYAHRLTKDTLPKVLGPRYLGGMLAQVKHAIEELRPGGQTKPGLTKKEEKRLADLDERLVDLEGFAAMIQAAVQRTNDRGETVGYVPDLNDGVVLAAAPLHEMIPWPKARKYRGRTISELRAYWEELAEGEYDWAHVAMLYWPTRVREKCQKDKSLALAHGLDAEFFPGLREELRRQADVSAQAPEEVEEAEPEDDQPEDDE